MIKSVGPGLGPGQAGHRPASTPGPPPHQTRLHTRPASTKLACVQSRPVANNLTSRLEEQCYGTRAIALSISALTFSMATGVFVIVVAPKNLPLPWAMQLVVKGASGCPAGGFTA